MGVLTAPLAVIEKDGQRIGLMTTVEASETIGRAEVQGIGKLTLSEVPATTWRGRVTCAQMMIDLNSSGIPDAVKRDVSSIQQWVDNVLLQEEGIDLVLLKRAKIGQNPDGNILAEYEEIGVIKNMFLTSDSFNISEGQISGRNQEFVYTTPITTVV
jgi:hypothetical protein|tara:strand:- start:1456 stop:1926 length:471 start_codon:yes stop_codon:yes gene_type:complete